MERLSNSGKGRKQLKQVKERNAPITYLKGQKNANWLQRAGKEETEL
jgi:hypothetical protein